MPSRCPRKDQSGNSYADRELWPEFEPKLLPVRFRERGNLDPGKQKGPSMH